MANQPKRYKKFVATAATATLVASAIAPVASASFKDVADNNDHKKNIEAIAELGYMGAGDNFRPSENVTRGQVAIILANWAQDVAGLEVPADYKTVQRFKDVPLTADDKLLQSAALVKDYGIFEGSNGNLNGANPISREHMALVLNKAFEAVNGTSLLDLAGDTSDVTFADEAKINKNYLPVVKALKKLGITAPASFNPSGNVTRGQFATFFIQTNNQEVEFNVASVSAINATTLEVKGSGLKALKAEDITVDGNTVVEVKPAADGKTATVTFVSGFPLDTENTVKVGDKEFKFTYSFNEVKSVTLDDKTVDDDTEGQILTFKINGATADTEWLRQAGYGVNFAAADEDNVAATIFEGASATSSTGLLDDEITVGEYTVEIQVTKDGKVVVSDKATITVADLESTTTAIKDVELTTTGGVVLNSTTLVVGEVADITEIIGNAAGKKDIELPVGLAEVTSSNPAVISVDEQELTANVAGTATITVKIGDVTKTINMTVKSQAREVAKVTPSEKTVKVVEGATRTIEVTAVDQYGDPIAVASADITEDIPENASGTDLVTAADLVTQADGETLAGYTIQGDEKGNGTILFKDADDKVVGQIAVQVTDVDNEGSTKVEHQIATTPVNYTIEAGDTEDYQVSIFNTNGFYNGVRTLIDSGTPAAGELLVESADTDVATVATSGTGIQVTGVEEGKTDITFKNAAGQVVHKITVTIEEEDLTITKVNFKAAGTIDYAGKLIEIADVLDVRVDGALDPIVYGVEHNADTIAKVRIDETKPNELILYIDDNGDGQLDATPGDDTILGAITATVLSGSTTATPGTPIAAITDITFGGGSYTTASKDKGVILFRVLVDGADGSTPDGAYSVSEAVATTTININVK